VIVPRLFDSKAPLHYKDIDLWFQTKEQVDAFIQAMGSNLIPGPFGSGAVKVTEQIYHFGREQYHLIKDNVVMAWIDVVISTTIPVNDFNVNTLTVRYTNSGAQIFESFGSEGIDTLIDAIHDKKVVMLPDYVPFLSMNGYSLIHSDRIKKNYLDHNWIVTYKDLIIPPNANLSWYRTHLSRDLQSSMTLEPPKETVPPTNGPTPATAEPATAEPATAEPVTAEPVKVEPVKETVASRKPSDPVLVMYRETRCSTCKSMEPIWETDLKPAILKEYPQLRVVTIVSENWLGKFDESIYPKQLKEYARWFPMVLLIPGPVWDQAIQTMNSETPSDLKIGVQIMNAVRDPDIKHASRYNITQISDYLKWIKEALDQPDFKRAQNSFGQPRLTEVEVSAIKTCLTIASKHYGKIFGDFVREVLVPNLLEVDQLITNKSTELWFRNCDQANAFIEEMGSRLISQLIPIDPSQEQDQDRNPIRWKLINCGTGKEIISISIIISNTIPIDDLNVNKLVAHYRNNNVEFESFGSEPINVLKAYIQNKTAVMLPNYKSLLIGDNRHVYQKYLNDKYLNCGWTLIYNGDQKMPVTITDNWCLDTFKTNLNPLTLTVPFTALSYNNVGICPMITFR
jgi:hypothetical protein